MYEYWSFTTVISSESIIADEVRKVEQSGKEINPARLSVLHIRGQIESKVA